MKYDKAVNGKFIDRPNRFIAHVLINGKKETVHVKNTGRCRELLVPGCDVTLALSDKPERKTRYDLVSVYKSGTGWINIDSQAPNIVMREWLEKCPEIFPDITLIKPEKVYGNSRVDFYIECGNYNVSGGIKRKIFIEVKGCTLEVNKTGYFPDAPTERGVKHLGELREALKEGYETYLAFVIAIPQVTEVLPNRAMHPAFGDALDRAVNEGVKVLYLPCMVSPDELKIIK